MGNILRLDFFTFSYVGFFVGMVCLVTAVHILLNKHEEPVSAVMWLVLVFSFPGAGVLLYVLFGINRIRTRGMKVRYSSERMRGELRAECESPDANGGDLKALANLRLEEREFKIGATSGVYPAHDSFLDRALPETKPLRGNSVDLLLDGSEAYPAMLEAMEAAERSIHLQSYIITNDSVGREVLRVLRRKADEGVAVKILYDKFGSFPAVASRFFAACIRGATNMEARAFAQAVPWGIQLRNHRKLLVVDGRLAFIGGINISADNDREKARRNKYIHDMHCRVAGPVVSGLQFAFLVDWHHVSGASESELLCEDNFPLLKEEGDSVARVVASGPGQCDGASEKLHMAATATATQSLWLATPYFVPDKSFLKALAAAAMRGVDVRIMVPARNNHWYVQLATRSLYPFLLDSGVRVYEREGEFFHAKATLVDRKWAKMGSSNCDVRSFRLNYELDLVVEGGEFISVLESQFKREFTMCREVVAKDVESKSACSKLAENFCALFTPVL